MAFVLDGKILRVGAPFKGTDGTQYPANWLRLTTLAEKEAIGIEEVADPATFDSRFYWGVGNPKRLNDENAVDENGDAVLDADGNQVVNYGLKTEWVKKQKETAGTLLAPSDWYVTRQFETSVEVPTAVSDYRAAVRTTCGTRESEIAACTTTEELAALLTNSAQVMNDDGEVVANTEPFITPWPEQG